MSDATKIREAVDDLVAAGAVYADLRFGPPGISLVLVALYWYDDPKRLRWVGAFPEHQGHVHEVTYDRLTREANGRGVGVHRDGEQVGSITPIGEARGLNPDEGTKTWRAWQRHVAERPHAAEQLREFAGEAV